MKRPSSISRTSDRPSGQFLLRSLLGGVLMGLANLVPGISGGTMLLAAGVYTAFVDAIAAVTRLAISLWSLVVLGLIGGSAAAVILTLAGPLKWAVVHHRWAMYSFFIGLTLGGVPVLWRMLRRPSLAAWTGCAGALAVMILLALYEPQAASQPSEPGPWILFIGGTLGASAMILPGISGGYLLLLLGLYIPILSALDRLKTGLETAHWPQVFQAALVLLPVAAGVLFGIAVVSNLIRYALNRFRDLTLGILLGLVLGAVVGLWPFQRPVMPQGNQRGLVALTEAEFEKLPLERFQPEAWQVLAALGLVAGGLVLTQCIARIGGEADQA